MNPDITESITGYRLEWKDIALIANIRRVRVVSDGQVKGDLEIIHINKTGQVCLLPSTQFNFSAELTRAKFANQMKSKLDLAMDWREIFDYLCVKIQDLARSGDSFVEVWPVSDAPKPEKMLGPIIYRNVQNIIFGEKGVSKSTLVYLFALCLALPWEDNPLGLEVPEKPTASLVLDWETDEAIFRYYLSRLMKGMNIPACPVYYRRCYLPLREDVEAIEKQIETSGVQLLIVDSLGAAAGGEHGELKGSESALLFNAALRKLKITSLIVGQTSKDTQTKRKSIFGSTFFEYYARNIFELCRGQGEEETIAHLGLFHRFSNLGKRMMPLGFSMEYDDETGGISVEREPLSISEFVEKVSTATRILDVLKSGALSQKDLRERLDVSYANLSMAMKRLQKVNKIIKLGDRWGLPAL